MVGELVVAKRCRHMRELEIEGFSDLRRLKVEEGGPKLDRMRIEAVSEKFKCIEYRDSASYLKEFDMHVQVR